MTTKKKSSFRGKVGKDARKNTRTSRSYLNLPEGVLQYNIEEGTKKVQFDILPYIISDAHHPNRDDDEGIAQKGDLWYKRPFKIHRDVGTLNESCVCLKSIGKPCPICDYQKKQFDAGADKEETVALYPKDRNLYVVIPIGQKKFEEIPYVWDMSQKLFQDTLKDALDEDDENEVFPDLEEGKTLEVSFKWKTFGKITFPEARNITFLDRDPYTEKILDDVPDLDTVLKVLTYEELRVKFFELDAEEDGGKLKDEDDDKPVRTRKTVKPAEDEDEDEPPVKRPARKPVVDEDEEDAPPARSTRREALAEKVPVKKNKCPHGHKFGIDNDEKEECNDCEVFDDCFDENKK